MLLQTITEFLNTNGIGIATKATLARKLGVADQAITNFIDRGYLLTLIDAEPVLVNKQDQKTLVKLNLI